MKPHFLCLDHTKQKVNEDKLPCFFTISFGVWGTDRVSKGNHSFARKWYALKKKHNKDWFLLFGLVQKFGC